MISKLDLIKEQQADEYCQKIKQMLTSEAEGGKFSSPPSRVWEMLNDVLCRRTENDYDEDDSLRPVVPKNLRLHVLKNFHSSIWGCHRGEKATFREIASRYFWPGLYEDVRDYVSKCDVCQLAKGHAPTKQGLLRGRHYSHVFTQICMDLVGPINQGSGQHARYLLVILDPFTHFVWIELIDNKLGDTVYKAFVNRILLEEGAPRCVLTDNGGEFKNKMLSELMTALKVHHQFSPAYHPQSNQTERANRNITELLRCVVNDVGARTRDWPRYVKLIEFAIRRQPISGTNISPFLMMRGREPVLPIDLPLMDIDDDADRPSITMPAHVTRLQAECAKASKLVKSAREKVMQKNKDLHDLSHKHIEFAEGELVRLWSSQHSSNGNAAKLKLRNAVYKITKRNNNMYDLENVEMPEVVFTNVHVSRIARWRGPAPIVVDEEGAVAPAGEAEVQEDIEPGHAAAGPDDDDDDDDDDDEDDVPVASLNRHLSPQDKLWEKLKPNKFVCFTLKDDPPSYLRFAEVQQIGESKRTAELWYWIHQSTAKHQPELPAAQRRLAPEWYNARGQTCTKPKHTAGLFSRCSWLSKSEITIILPCMDLWVGGKVKPADVKKIDNWLKTKSKTTKRALRAVSDVRTLSLVEAKMNKKQRDIEHRESPHSELTEAEQYLLSYLKKQNASPMDMSKGFYDLKPACTADAPPTIKPNVDTKTTNKSTKDKQLHETVYEAIRRWRPW